MNTAKVRVRQDSIHAYGDTRGTGVYYRDPKTGVVYDGSQNSKRHSDRSRNLKLPPSNKIRAIDLYDKSIEGEKRKEKNEEDRVKVVPDVDKSKFRTSYQPKSHFRYHNAYRIMVNDEPPPEKAELANEPMAAEEAESNEAATPLAEAAKSKKQARPRRTQTPVQIEEFSDEDEKKTFVGWVMNGKRDDLGISQRILFKKSA